MNMAQTGTLFQCEPCKDPDQWNRFVAHSPQGTRYCNSDIINALDCEADYWLLMRNGYPVAGIPVVTRTSTGSALPPHSYYTGLMLHPEAWRGKANRRTENLLAISEQAMHHLCEIYSAFQLCLHPDITDVRGFDWFHYHTPEQGRIQIAPRYTARIDLDSGDVFAAARGSRRREYQYAQQREQQSFASDGTVDELLHLWQASLARQGQLPDPAETAATKHFAEYLLAREQGIIGVTRTAGGEATTAGLLMLDYHQTAHLPVVGTGETRYGGSLLYFSLMQTAAENGCRVLDFNGANSPQRGYFKHSIGGEACLYFQLQWQRPA